MCTCTWGEGVSRICLRVRQSDGGGSNVEPSSPSQNRTPTLQLNVKARTESEV